MRKVFLEALPKRGKIIDWKNSIGLNINFIYDNISGNFKIINYENNYITLQYKNEKQTIFSGNLRKCNIGNLLGVKTSTYKFILGEIIENVKSGRLKIIKQKRKFNHKAYLYKCLICNNIDTTLESSIISGYGCNVCGKQKVLEGYNDLWTTEPLIAKSLWNQEDGYKYMRNSNAKLNWKCKDCGEEIKKKSIFMVVNSGLSCPICSDGISIPEKFMIAFFSQTSYLYETQVEFSWSKNTIHSNSRLCGTKRYDGYLSQFNTIIEIHGRQHYRKAFSFDDSLSFEEIQMNDQIKENLAISNNFNYVIINALISDFYFLKNSVLNSDLGKIINLSKIDWVKCWEFASGNLIKQVCALFKSGIKISEISNMLKINRSTVRDYLKRGMILGWCDYNPKESRRTSGIEAGKRSRKQVIQISLKDEVMKEWRGLTEVQNTLGISTSLLSRVCKGKGKTAGGFKWMYKEDYDQYIEQAN